MSENINNEIYSLSDTAAYAYTTYGWVKGLFGISTLNALSSETEYEQVKIYAPLEAASLISGINVKISGLDGLSKAQTLNNIASAIKAENLLVIEAEQISNEGLGKINLDEERGIKINVTETPIPWNLADGVYFVTREEKAEVIHSAKEAEMSGEETAINAVEITNISSKIEGRSKLEINAENLTNTAIMFKDKIWLTYFMKGREQGRTMFGGITTNRKAEHTTMYGKNTHT